MGERLRIPRRDGGAGNWKTIVGLNYSKTADWIRKSLRKRGKNRSESSHLSGHSLKVRLKRKDSKVGH